MTSLLSRRGFLAGALLARPAPAARSPHDYIVVEGHRDIWEFNDRLQLRDRAQHSPLRDFLLPRLLEGGVSVVIMPAGGDSVDERAGVTNLLEGSLRVVDMLLVEIDKTNGAASLIKTKADLPARPNRGKVQIFFDLEGGGSIQIDPEPGYHSDRRLALLRHFFRLGVRGMQLTHNGRNMLPGVGAQGSRRVAQDSLGDAVVRPGGNGG